MSIAAKLTTIAENQEKVYNKGALDYSPQETVSGEAIGITDISPIEHNMGVSVRKMNLLKYPYVGTSGGTSTGLTITDNGDGTLTINGTETDSTKYKSFFFMDKELHDYLIDGLKYYKGIEKPDSTLAGQIYILVKNNATGANEWLSGNSFTVNKSKYTYSRIYVQINGSSSVFDNTVFKPYLTLYDTKKYAPYIEDISTVKLYKQGKNLFNFDVDLIKAGYPDFGEATLVEKTENGVIVQGKLATVGEPGMPSWYNGWFQPHLTKTTNGVYLKNGDTVTISADYTWLDISSYTANSPLYIHLCTQNNTENNIGKDIGKKPTEADIGKTFRVKVTHTNTKGDGYFIPIFTLNSCKVKIENIQISYDSNTEYEPYIEPTIYDVATDGTVEGVASLYPSTTLYTDTSGAVIDCTYYQDGRKVKENLTDMILSLGGVINE